MTTQGSRLGSTIIPAKPRPQMTTFSIEDLEEGGFKDAVIEGKVLTRYGTYDKMQSGHGSPNMKHLIINADFTDNKGLATVTISCYGDIVCPKFSDYLRPGVHIRITNFGMKNRNFQQERGDLSRTIKLVVQSKVEVLADFKPPIVLKFFANDTITNFRKRLEERYAYTTLAVAVFHIFAQKENMYTVQIADGDTEEDRFVLEMEDERKSLFDKLCDKVVQKVPALILLKNVTVNSFNGNCSFTLDRGTIVSEVTSPKTRTDLTAFFEKLCVKNSASRDVIGTLTVSNPAAPHYKTVCSNYKLQNYTKLDSSTLHCKTCIGEYQGIWLPWLPVAIQQTTDNSVVSCHASDHEIEIFTSLSGVAFLNLEDSTRIEIASRIKIVGEVKVTAKGEVTDIKIESQNPINIDEFVNQTDPLEHHLESVTMTKMQDHKSYSNDLTRLVTHEHPGAGTSEHLGIVPIGGTEKRKKLRSEKKN